MRDLESRQGPGEQRSAPSASEAQAPRGAPREIPAQPGLVLRPGKLGRWRCASGPLPASRTLGVHPAGLGGRKGHTVPERLAVGVTPPQNGFS